MDFLPMCLILTLSLTLITHAVFSAPALDSDDLEMDEYQPDFDADLSLIRERRADDSLETDDFLTRIRRQVAQLASSRRPSFSSRRGRHRSRGRLNGRRHYDSLRGSRTNGKGQVVNW